MKIIINGRFQTIPKTGVRRVARQLVEHLDRSLVTNPSEHQWVMIHPAKAEPLEGLKAIRSEPLSGLPGQLWEQTALPRAGRSGVLVNLANTAPMRASRSIVMIHDAQVFDTPGSYGFAFRTWYRFMQPRACRNAARVLTVSRYSAERLEAHRVVRDAAAVQVLFNGVDHIRTFEPPAGVVERKGLGARPFLLAFASDQPHKNTRLLLELAKSPQLAGFDMVLIGSQLPRSIAGGGELPGDVSAGGNVKLLRHVADAELPTLYESAFAFLLPSFTEGFGLTAGEAMLCGAPVIASNSGSLGEIWAGGARLAAPDKPQEWIDAILELTSPDARESRRQAGLAHASRFTWERAASELRRIIETVAEEPAKR